MTTSHTGPVTAPPSGTSALIIDLPDDLPPETQAQIAAFLEEWEQETKTGGDALEALERINRRKSDALIEDAVQRSRAGETDWGSLVHRLGRNDTPSLLRLVWNRLPLDERVKAVGDAWTGAEYPERALRRVEWLFMFRAVGYHDDDKPATPPEQITLWRGGVKKTRMSWTGDRERAVWFQHRFSDIGKPGKLWTVTVGPDRLLAHYHELHRGEDEYVIDPTGLRPKEVDR
jgi:hypothetical protein